MHKPPKLVTQKTDKSRFQVHPRGPVLGNCPQIKNETKQKLSSNT